MPRIVAETSVDKTVPVTVIRNGKEIVIDVTLGELEVAENDGLISNRRQLARPSHLPIWALM